MKRIFGEYLYKALAIIITAIIAFALLNHELDSTYRDKVIKNTEDIKNFNKQQLQLQLRIERNGQVMYYDRNTLDKMIIKNSINIERIFAAGKYHFNLVEGNYVSGIPHLKTVTEMKK